MKSEYMKDESADKTATGSLDREELAAIFDKYAPALYKYLIRLGIFSQEADQIIGDVFLRLLDKIADGKGPRTNIRAYLFQSAYHLVVDQAREMQRTTPLDVADSVKEEIEPVQSQVEENMLLENLSTMIKQDLTKDQMNVIVLRFQEEFSIKETANIIGKKVNAVKAIQSRGLEKLRQALRAKDEGK
ncbi:MAG: sigma-70 family RNA polymerase sigma factor [Anaerolineae bacterium]|nr:sigma-70 family RNA polymerase sigma factor [Anaerolineae bacterium]